MGYSKFWLYKVEMKLFTNMILLVNKQNKITKLEEQ